MKKIYLLVLFVMCFLISAVTVKAEELEVGNLLSGWKLSGDVSMFATFKGEERNTDSKLNFMYMQFYGEKEIQKNLTLYLSLVVNNVGYDNDVNDYETTILVDTAFLSYAVNDVFSLHIGREIINYGYENPICIIDEKFAFLPTVSSDYFGGYILRGDGVGIVVRNSVVDVNAAYMNIPTDNTIQGKSYYARVSKTMGSLTLGVNGLFTKGPDSAIQGDAVSYFGPDIKFENDLLDFRTEVIFANRETDFGSGTESVNRLGFYSQVTVNLLSEKKLYVGSRLDYDEPYTLYDKEINRYLSGVVGSYIYDNVLVRAQYKSNIDIGQDSEIGFLMTVTF